APTAPAAMDWTALLSRAARIAAADEERLRGFGMPNASSTVISSAGGMPDSALFPTDAFRKVLNQVVRDEGESLLQYASVGSYAPLRRYLAGYLLRFGVEARAEEILIVNGAQQGFNLIARTLLDPGDVVAIEQPTYTGAMQGFRACGARLLPVEWDAAGPRPDVFQRLCERQAPKLFYCQSSGHNPTGLTIEPQTRRRLVYARRRTRLLAALRRRMPEGVSWTEPHGGFSLLLTLPIGLTATALLPTAVERGVAFTPGPAFFIDGGGERTLRLAFSSVAAARIDEGVRRLAEAIKAARRQPRPRRTEHEMVPVV